MSHATIDSQVVQVKPRPNIYTVLLIVAILALCVGIGFCGHRLLSSPGEEAGGGYGLKVGDLFKPVQVDKVYEADLDAPTTPTSN